MNDLTWGDNVESEKSDSEEELQRILDSLTVRLVRLKKDMNLQEFCLELTEAFGIFVKENYPSVLKQEEMSILYERASAADYYKFYLEAVVQISVGKKL